MHFVYFVLFIVRVPWCSGSHSWFVIRGLVVRVPSGTCTYAPGQGILLTVVSLNPGVVNGYWQESIPCLPCAPKLQVAGHSRGNNNELFVKHLENYLIITMRYINQNYYYNFILLLLFWFIFHYSIWLSRQEKKLCINNNKSVNL